MGSRLFQVQNKMQTAVIQNLNSFSYNDNRYAKYAPSYVLQSWREILMTSWRFDRQIKIPAHQWIVNSENIVTLFKGLFAAFSWKGSCQSFVSSNFFFNDIHFKRIMRKIVIIIIILIIIIVNVNKKELAE